jgi:hypothetical protein
MANITSTESRQALKYRFVRTAIPTQADLAYLIDASLNQADDGLLKLPNEPLGLVCQQLDKPVLQFYDAPDAAGSAWQIQLSADNKPGYCLADKNNTTRLFIDAATGNIGIGTTSPTSQLQVDGTIAANALTVSGSASLATLTATGATSLATLSATGSTSLADLAVTGTTKLSTLATSGTTNLSTLTVNGTTNLVTLTASGATSLGSLTVTGQTNLVTLATNGNTSMCSDAFFLDSTSKKVGIGTATPGAKLHILEAIGTAASATSGSLLIDRNDSGGASSIVFRSRGNAGSDYAFMEYREKNPGLPNNAESGLLTLGIQNDTDDHIALMPSGNVGIGTNTPGSRLTVQGGIQVSENITLATDKEVLFADNGQIRSYDDNHRLLFRRQENIMELREFGSIIFSCGSRKGAENAKMIILENGNVGIGTKTPTAKLSVQGALTVSDATNFGGQVDMLSASNPIRMSSAWTGFPDDKVNGAEISNDVTGYKTLMIVGNKAAGGPRSVSVWDVLNVNGNLKVTATVTSDKLQVNSVYLGSKWMLTATEDGQGNDGWLRLASPVNKNAFSGGFAAEMLWSKGGAIQGSDLRLKIDSSIKPFSGALDKLIKLDPVEFKYKDQPHRRLPHMGFIAQEVEKIIPEAVETGPDGMKGIQLGCLIAVMAQALKDLTQTVNEQQSRILDLQKQHPLT